MSKYGKRHSIKRRDTAKSRAVWAKEYADNRRTIQAAALAKADPLKAEGLALGAVITDCPMRPPAATPPAVILVKQPLTAAPEPPPAAQSEQRTPLTIACDVELARLAVGLKQAPLFRVWLVMLQSVRESGKNYLSRVELAEALTAAGVKHTERNLRRWLRQGECVYWHLTNYGRVKFIGYAALSLSLAAYARAIGLPDLVSTNTPGQRKFMYITASSRNLIEFEANVYAAWLASKENPTISRFVLTTLFNRDARALREWEEIAGIEKVHNFAHFTSDHTAAIPQEDGELRADVQERTIRREGAELTIWRAQMVNTYIVPTAIKQHGYRGQSRRVARKVKQMLESSEPAGVYGQDADEQSSTSGGLQPTGHRYFADHKRAKASAKHSGEKARFVPLAADDGNSYIWEFSPDGQQRLDFWECVQEPTRSAVYA